jgi:hypothetical protein
MLRDGTVFILGAAVSAEVGFPLGGKLKEEISNLLPARADQVGPKQFPLVDAMDRAIGHRWFGKATELRRGLQLADSIDNLVEHRTRDDPDLARVAKMGIAAAIAYGEMRGANGLRLTSGLKDTSYVRIFKLIVSGCPRDRLADALERVQFITFNYDRSLEVFLRVALEHYSGLDARSAADLASKVEIHHVYGSLGSVPESLEYGYGQEPNALSITAMAAGIRTYSEEIESERGDDLRRVIRDARRVIVLGCAHHPRNMKLLDPDGLAGFQEVYGTQYLEPPEDAVSRPPFAEFTLPAVQAFKTAINHWQYRSPNRIEVTDFRIEPLTSLQLIARYGSSWLDHG